MGKSENENVENQVNLGDRVKGKIEMPRFDPTPFIGKEAKIASVTEHQGDFGYFIKVTTEPVTKLKDQDISASRILGLIEDADGNLGWEDTKTGKLTDLGNLLKKHGVGHYSELVGKTVILQTRTAKKNGESQDFLTF